MPSLMTSLAVISKAFVGSKEVCKPEAVLTPCFAERANVLIDLCLHSSLGTCLADVHQPFLSSEQLSGIKDSAYCCWKQLHLLKARTCTRFKRCSLLLLLQSKHGPKSLKLMQEVTTDPAAEFRALWGESAPGPSQVELSSEEPIRWNRVRRRSSTRAARPAIDATPADEDVIFCRGPEETKYQDQEYSRSVNACTVISLHGGCIFTQKIVLTQGNIAVNMQRLVPIFFVLTLRLSF